MDFWVKRGTFASALGQRIARSVALTPEVLERGKRAARAQSAVSGCVRETGS